MRTVGYYLINIGFLLYGLARLVGSGFGFGQAMGWSDSEIGRGVTEALVGSYDAMAARAIVALPVEGHLGWTLLMGVVLTAGALFALFKARLGYVLMGSYLVLFALMFANYQTFNEKIVHLAVGVVLFVVMLLLSGRRSA